mgnify:CR=1 FL=1
MPSPLTNSTLTTLKKKILLSVDSWNSDDTIIETPGDLNVDTLGERARLCINQALGTIYGLIKDSKYLEAYPTTAYSSIASQDYVELAIVPELDDIETVVDTSNDFKLIRKSWSWYRKNYTDPASQTGTPRYYIPRNERMYFAPRPSAVLPYLVDFKKLTRDLKLNGDVVLIPEQFDGWIIQEAKVKWYEMEDPNSIPIVVISERDSVRQISIDTIMTGYDHPRVAASHFSRNDEPRSYGYQRPVG